MPRDTKPVNCGLKIIALPILTLRNALNSRSTSTTSKKLTHHYPPENRMYQLLRKTIGLVLCISPQTIRLSKAGQLLRNNITNPIFWNTGSRIKCMFCDSIKLLGAISYFTN